MQAEQRIADPSKLIKLTDVLAIIPFSKSTWWLGVKSGRYPKPVKIGTRTNCWRLSEIRDFATRGI